MAEEAKSVEPEGNSESVQTARCPSCHYDNEVGAKKCATEGCKLYLKSELECLRTIDISLRTVKNIAVWWFVLSILGAAVYILGKFW